MTLPGIGDSGKRRALQIRATLRAASNTAGTGTSSRQLPECMTRSMTIPDAATRVFSGSAVKRSMTSTRGSGRSASPGSRGHAARQFTDDGNRRLRAEHRRDDPLDLVVWMPFAARLEGAGVPLGSVAVAAAFTAAALLPCRDHRVLLALQAATALLVDHLLDTGW
jgi:hypothetical protein